jgi:hypothetical protein
MTDDVRGRLIVAETAAFVVYSAIHDDAGCLTTGNETRHNFNLIWFRSENRSNKKTPPRELEDIVLQLAVITVSAHGPRSSRFASFASRD